MRTVCSRCRRPASVCYCAALPVIDTRTRVVLFQHPRERRVAIGTARMAHVALKNSELWVGLDFEESARLRSLAAAPERVVLLYPGEGVPTPDALEGPPPETLLVIDGTWPQARKLLKRNPVLSRFRRVGLAPSKPGNYRIRREPAPHCLSTVEAVVGCLAALEGSDSNGRLEPMLEAFDRMVDFQLESERTRTTPRRRRIRTGPPKHPRLPSLFTEAPERIVCLCAEANAYPAGSGYPPELVQVTAVRPFTGERLELLARPKNPLAIHVTAQLEVTEALLFGAPELAESMSALRRWLRPDDAALTWGNFTRELLGGEGVSFPTVLEARDLCARWFRGRPGALEEAVERIDPGGLPQQWAHGRAGRRIHALERIVLKLIEAARPAPTAAPDVRSVA